MLEPVVRASKPRSLHPRVKRPKRKTDNLPTWFDVFSTVHHSIELFHQPTLMYNFIYSLPICLLHYYPRHVSSINMPIFMRKNCIHTALNQCTVQAFTESEDTRCCVNTIFPPEDGHVNARNMSRIIV